MAACVFLHNKKRSSNRLVSSIHAADTRRAADCFGNFMTPPDIQKYVLLDMGEHQLQPTDNSNMRHFTSRPSLPILNFRRDEDYAGHAQQFAHQLTRSCDVVGVIGTLAKTQPKKPRRRWLYESGICDALNQARSNAAYMVTNDDTWISFQPDHFAIQRHFAFEKAPDRPQRHVHAQ